MSNKLPTSSNGALPDPKLGSSEPDTNSGSFETTPLHDEELLKKKEAMRATSEIMLNPGDGSFLRIRRDSASIKDYFSRFTRILTSKPDQQASEPEGLDLNNWERRPYNNLEQPISDDKSHSMFLVGESDLGPKHGVSRYIDYQVESSSPNSITVSAVDSLRNLGHLKTFETSETELTITDELINLSDEEQGLSLGEHLYFACNEALIPGIRFIHPVDGAGQTIKAIDKKGKTFIGTMAALWPRLQVSESLQAEFNGSQIIDFGDGRVVKIEAWAESEQDGAKVSAPVELLIWHRKETDTICFEPICGRKVSTDGSSNNQMVNVKPGETFKLVVKITTLFP